MKVTSGLQRNVLTMNPKHCYNKSMKCGVYKIRNLIDGKIYIGSSVNIGRRMRRHKTDIVRGLHSNKHLQRAILKYGKNNFTIETIETCDKENLQSREQFYIDELDVCEKGYNISPIAYSNKGVKHTKETLEKMSQALRGKKFTNEHKEKISLALKAHQRTKEHCKNISNKLERNFFNSSGVIFGRPILPDLKCFITYF